MPDLGLLLLPLTAVAIVTLVGSGFVALLAPDLPTDASAALAPLAGAAWIAAASTLLPLGVPTRPLALVALGAGLAVSALLRRRVVRMLGASAVPVALAVGAIALAGAPSLARGDWQVTSLYESTDAYHWVSQGRAYFEGPAPEPVSEHPDRLTYERSRTQHWAVAVPFGAGLLGWLSGSDVANTYGALAAALFALLPLATYAAARAALGWTRRLAVTAGAALALNASLLFASHFSWQQQVVGSALAFSAAVLLWLGLSGEAPRGTLLLAGLLTAGAIGTYRLGFAPFLAALLAAVVVARAWQARDPRTVARRAAVFVPPAVVLAAPSLFALARGLPGYIDSGGFSTTFKEEFAGGQPAEALGLVPHIWALEDGWPDWLRLVWLAVASALAAGLLVAGALRGRAVRSAAFVLAGTGLVVVGYALLLLPRFAPYLSYKVLAYGAPFLVLLALTPLAHWSGRATRAATATAGVLLVGSSVVATVAAGRAARTPARLADGLLLSTLPADAVVTVSTADPWRQAWELYDLRNLRVSVERPTYLLTKQGVERQVVYRHRPASYAIVYTEAGAATVVPVAEPAAAANSGRTGVGATRPRPELGLSGIAAPRRTGGR
jgi:hypothetical protein